MSKKFLYAGGLVFTIVLGALIGLLVQQYVLNDLQEVTYEEYVGKPTPNCVSEGREDFPCYDVFYNNLVLQYGVPAAFADLKQRYESTASVRGECHQITHAIGHAGAKLAGGVGAAFALGDPVCWSGYYHGVMESILTEVGEEALPEKLNDVCSTIPGKSTYAFGYYNCVHGLGHGVMKVYKDDIPKSLAACDTLEGEWEQSSCAGGVFMENIMIEDRGGVSDYLKKDDPVYPCNAVEEKYKPDCYLMQTSYMLRVFDEDFTKVFATCDEVEIAHRGTCYQSVGRDASGRSISNAEQTKATCMLGKDTFAQENCVVGAVKDFVSYFHSDTEARELCSMLRPDLGAVCENVLEEYYAAF